MKSARKNIQNGYSALVAVLTGLLLLATAGCTSTGEGTPSNSFAAVVISGKTRQEIIEIATKVFVGKGYAMTRPVNCDVAFERRGSQWDSLTHGGLMDTSVWYRVRLSIRLMSATDRLLEAEVFRVNDHGDAALEEERRLRNAQRKPYQELLDEVRKAANGEPPNAAS